MADKNICFHCGEKCDGSIQENELSFCCAGCKQVYLLLSENELCQFYELGENPGISAKGKFTDKKFSYLDEPTMVQQLAHFVSKDKVNISFFLPQMHCSSCVFLLEKLDRIQKGITKSTVDFTKKTIFVSYDPNQIGLKDLVELLAFIGYEPELTLNDTGIKQISPNIKESIMQIGVAGFCFGYIMMLSFPDYFSNGDLGISGMDQLFSMLIFLLSLPVILYSAKPIFSSAYKSLRQREINIDVPIALASLITFGRSYFDIFSGVGSGFLDSGTGIIFFMLIGRWFQGKTYDALSFDRKFKSYFPLGVTIVNGYNQEISIPMNQLKIGERVLTRNEELIPADSVLLSETANIDYSFVTGENECVKVKKGELIYAGGKLIGPSIFSEPVKLPSQSYITELWNNSVFDKNKEIQSSFVHPWSRYFTLVLFSIAFISGLYWFMVDASKVWLVITSVLIVACPCSLLLSATFTYGNMLRVLGKNKLFLKNAHVIETMSGITDIVFDKTGTITEQSVSAVTYHGNPMQENEKILVRHIASHSGHLLSKSIFNHLQTDATVFQQARQFKEIKGRGIEGEMFGYHVRMGNSSFVLSDLDSLRDESSMVHLQINEDYKGYFKIRHKYRLGLSEMIQSLKGKFNLHLISGDCDAEREKMLSLFGSESSIQFSTLPQDKLDYIKKLQEKGKKVLMIGDGLNDAGALMQSDVGLAVSEKQAHFTPASDGIIDGTAVVLLPELLSYARSGKYMVSIGFAVSVIYNIVGVGFAIQGLLSPVFAAILMPLSSITIVSLAIALSSIRGNIKPKFKKNIIQKDNLIT